MSDEATRLEQEAAFARSFALLVYGTDREKLRVAEEKNRELADIVNQARDIMARYGFTEETYRKPNAWRDLVNAHFVELKALQTRLDRVTQKLRSLENKNREAAEKTRADKLAALRKKQALHERQKLRDETRLERLAALRRKSANAAASADQRALCNGRSSKIHQAPGNTLGNSRRSVRGANR